MNKMGEWNWRGTENTRKDMQIFDFESNSLILIITKNGSTKRVF